MKVIKEINKFCSGCLNEHTLQIVEVEEKELFNDELVKFTVEYNYCDVYDVFTENEEQIRKNFKRMKGK